MKLLTKAGLAAAKARAKLTDEARAMGRSVLAKRATDKAADYALERFPIDVNRNVMGDSLGLANQIQCLQRQHAGARDGKGILE
jgi:hypothetical protein